MSRDPAPRRVAFAVGAVSLIIGTVTLNRFLVGVFYDDGLYAGLALALARGLGYVHPHLPGMPAAVHYPPFYPLVLAPLYGLLSVDSAGFAAKAINLGCGGAAAALTAWHAVRYRLLGDHVPPWIPGLVVAAAATAIPVLAVQGVVFSEPLFAVLLVTAFILTDAVPDAPRPPRGAVRAGTAIALALLTRSIGVAAAAGAVLWLGGVRNDRRAAARAALVPLACFAAWSVWVALHRGGIDPALGLNYGSYAEVIRQTGVAGLGRGALDLARPLAALSLGVVPAGPLRALTGLGVMAVAAYGLFLVGRRSSAGVTLAVYVAILCVWPYPPDRFLWVVLPWIALATVAGGIAMWARRPLRPAVAALAALVVAGTGQYQIHGFAGRWWESAARPISENFAELLPAIRELPPSAVVATDDEALVWLHTGRRAVPLYLFAYQGRRTIHPGPAEQRAYLARQGVTHVLLADPGGESAVQLRALIHSAPPGWLTPVRSFPGARWLFAVNQAAP